MIFINKKLVKQKVILWIVSFCLILGNLCVPVSYAETKIYHQDELGANVFGFSKIGNSQVVQVQAADFNDISRETIWTKDNFKGKYNLHFEDASGRNNSGAAVAESTNFSSQEWPAFYQILTGLPEGKPVEFSAWIKSENIVADEGVGAYIAISYLNSAGQRISFNQSLNVKGSRDWKQFKATGIIPEGTVKVRISLIMYGKGKAYFDDAQLSVYPNAVQTKGAYSEKVNLVITDEKLNSNLLGFAVQNNPFTFKNDGLTQEDKSLINSRISELKPAWVRVFVDTSWWVMSDGYNFDTSMMNALVEDLKMYNNIGSKINLVMWRPMELRSNEVIATQMSDLVIWLKNKGLNISGLTLYNEPDGEFPGTIEEYIAMYKTMAKALKSKGLENVELIGGDVSANDSFLSNIAKPLDSEIGMLSYHGYFKYKDSLKQPLFRAARNSMYSDKNLFLWESNETGGKSDSTVTFTPGYDPVDGKLLPERYSSALKITAYYLQSLALGVKGISYWEVFDMTYSSSDKPKIMRFGMWGLKSEGFKLRPIYYAFQALSKNILPGATIHKVDVGENNSLVSYMVENIDGTRVLYALNPWDKPVQVSTTLSTSSDLKVSRYMFESDSVENAIQKQEVAIKTTEQGIAVKSKYTDIIPAESMLVLKLTKSMQTATPERAVSEETPKITQEATLSAIPKATPESTPKATPEITSKGTPESTPKATPNDIKEESSKNDINNDYRFISGKNKKITFKDIPSSHWAKTSIEILAGEGVINGKENNCFHPKENITRSEFAKIAGELLGLKYDSAYKNPFKDIRSSDWYYEHVIKAVSGNIINGKSEGYFYPKDNITRQEVFTIIYRIASNYCYDGKNDPITKSSNNNTQEYKDAGQISDYAKEALNTLLEYNIVSGYKDGTIKPGNTMTRAEAASIIYKVATTFKPKEKIEKVENIKNVKEPATNKETDKSVGRYKLTQSNTDNLIWTDYASERVLKV